MVLMKSAYKPEALNTREWIAVQVATSDARPYGWRTAQPSGKTTAAQYWDHGSWLNYPPPTYLPLNTTWIMAMEVQQVPEPAALGMFALGAVVIALCRRRC
jgi:hypothetical protein